jgi:hypothetical protein
MGALFLSGSAFEAALLLVSMAVGWKLGPYHPGPAAFAALLVVGAAAVAATAGLGIGLMRAYVRRVALIELRLLGTPLVEAGSTVALILGISAVVLLWPFGILLGPAAFFVGVSAVRRINAAAGRLTGAGRAQAGAIMGSVVSGMYLCFVLVQVVAIFAFGAPIPAAPGRAKRAVDQCWRSRTTTGISRSVRVW